MPEDGHSLVRAWSDTCLIMLQNTRAAIWEATSSHGQRIEGHREWEKQIWLGGENVFTGSPLASHGIQPEGSHLPQLYTIPVVFWGWRRWTQFISKVRGKFTKLSIAYKRCTREEGPKTCSQRILLPFFSYMETLRYAEECLQDLTYSTLPAWSGV